MKSFNDLPDKTSFALSPASAKAVSRRLNTSATNSTIPTLQVCNDNDCFGDKDHGLDLEDDIDLEDDAQLSTEAVPNISNRKPLVQSRWPSSPFPNC